MIHDDDYALVNREIADCDFSDIGDNQLVDAFLAAYSRFMEAPDETDGVPLWSDEEVLLQGAMAGLGKEIDRRYGEQEVEV